MNGPVRLLAAADRNRRLHLPPLSPLSLSRPIVGRTVGEDLLLLLLLLSLSPSSLPEGLASRERSYRLRISNSV